MRAATPVVHASGCCCTETVAKIDPALREAGEYCVVQYLTQYITVNYSKLLYYSKIQYTTVNCILHYINNISGYSVHTTQVEYHHCILQYTTVPQYQRMKWPRMLRDPPRRVPRQDAHGHEAGQPDQTKIISIKLSI